LTGPARQALEARERILGPDHPDTAATRLNLAVAIGAHFRILPKLPAPLWPLDLLHSNAHISACPELSPH
jgi:hypothetical protein